MHLLVQVAFGRVQRIGLGGVARVGQVVLAGFLSYYIPVITAQPGCSHLCFTVFSELLERLILQLQ